MWRVNSRCVTSPRDFETCNGEESKGKIQVVNWIKKNLLYKKLFTITIYTFWVNMYHILDKKTFLYMLKSYV